MHSNMIAAVVTRRWQLAQGYHAVEVETRHRSEVPPFDDGAIIDLTRDHECRTVRSHPLWHLPSRVDAFVVGVRQEADTEAVRDVSDFSWNRGDELYIGRPRNTEILMDCNSRYILFSAGLGVTAIYGIAKRLAAAEILFEIHNFARTLERTLFREELDSLSAYGRVHHRIGLKEEEIELATSLALSPTHANSQIIFSGPPSFMKQIGRQAREWVYPSNIHKILLGEKGVRG
ncbi:oxidoreductase [Paraburkholderia sp. A2RI-6]|uniref:oxidoreductase n=1 Tax=Paraburkholderia sp. A2RI-6 TaxID=3028371 RepID=UPI003B79BC60